MMDRRSFLRASGVTAVSAAIGVAGACGSSEPGSDPTDTGSGRTTATSSTATGSTKSSSAGSDRLALPDFVPYTGVKADLPATAAGADPGFLKFPEDNPALYTDKPASSKEFTAMIMASLGTPPLIDKNKYWQALNDALGTQMNVVMAPPGDYPAKFSSAIAGGDLPDVAMLLMNTARLPQIVDAEFADLTDYVGGDAVHKYKALANITTQRWKSAIIDGRVRGIPQSRSSIASVFSVRSDVCEKRGLDPVIKSGQDLLTLFRGLTDLKNSQWAFDRPDDLVGYLLETLEGPNVWREDGGQFESQYTSDEYRQALQFTASMWKEGLFHPDSYSLSNAQKLANINGGHVLTSLYNNYGAYFIEQTVGPEYHLAPSLPPKFDGGGVVPQFLTPGIAGLTVIKKGSKSRVEEMLRVVDWFTAPFGTKDYIQGHYGIADWDYTRKDDIIAKTPTGVLETKLQVAYIGFAPPQYYYPGHDDATRDLYNYGKAVMPTAILPANVGLYSDTDQTHGATLLTALSSVERDVITGRKPLSAWDQAVKTWRKGGGDQIRSEYEAAHSRLASE